MTISLSNTKYLNTIHTLCFRNNIPFVSYCLPDTSSIITLIQTNSYPRKLSSLKNLNNEKGFVITPFVNSPLISSYILEPDVIIDTEPGRAELIDYLENIKIFQSIEYLNGHGIYDANREEFTNQVEKIKEEIKKGNIKKAVLSRISTEPKAPDFNASQLFYELTQKYPGAFVYLFNIPNAGCWTGATPEPLLTIKQGQVETISLAGTRKAGKTQTEKVSWSEKEIEEQDIVTQYIENVLAHFRIHEYSKSSPFTFKAGSVVHLKTRFLFDAACLENRLGELVEALHPTPSVCGLPKMEAYKFLKTIEVHQREYYTGLLGPVNINNETGLYVNLRCMKVLENKLALYLGAGITSGSIPLLEWEETNQKKMTLQLVLEKLNKNT